MAPGDRAGRDLQYLHWKETYWSQLAVLHSAIEMMKRSKEDDTLEFHDFEKVGILTVQISNDSQSSK